MLLVLLLMMMIILPECDSNGNSRTTIITDENDQGFNTAFLSLAREIRCPYLDSIILNLYITNVFLVPFQHVIPLAMTINIKLWLCGLQPTWKVCPYNYVTMFTEICHFYVMSATRRTKFVTAVYANDLPLSAIRMPISHTIFDPYS